MYIVNLSNLHAQVLNWLEYQLECNSQINFFIFWIEKKINSHSRVGTQSWHRTRAENVILNGFNFLKISYLAAECAKILWVLSDFHLFDGFTEGSTITGSIFTNNSDLLGAFSLENLTRENFKTQIHHNYHGRSDLKSFTNTNSFNLDLFEQYMCKLFPRCHRYIQIFDRKNFSPLLSPEIITRKRKLLGQLMS